MVVLISLAGSLIMGIIEYLLFFKNEGAKRFFATVFRHLILDSMFTILLLISVFKYEHFLMTYEYGIKDYAIVFIVTLVVGLYFMLLSKTLRKHNSFEKDEIKSKKVIITKIITLMFFILSLFFGFGSKFIRSKWGTIGTDQFLVNIFSPTEGTETSVYYSAFEGVIFAALLITVVLSFVLFYNFSLKIRIKDKPRKISENSKRKFLLTFSILFLCTSLVYTSTTLSISDFYKIYFVKSDFIEENYQDPLKTTISAPEQKRNLIFFYLESVENTYLSKDLGGNMETNLMPELASLADEGIVFSDNSGKFGGPTQIVGTQWSLASMVNQSMGLPLKAPKTMNAYSNGKHYIENGVALGDILKENGYNQTVMIGAKAAFGGLDVFYKSHGGYNVFDYDYAINNNYLPKNYHVFWGYEDDKLYEFAKDEILRLYKEGKPFNFTFENADTHAPQGYLSKNAPKPFDDAYSNAIAYSTSQVVEFVRWVQKQPFYKDTTIILIGDHLSMAPDYFNNMDLSNYKRTTFNLILNPSPQIKIENESVTKNRQYSTIDIYPTILTAMGFKIDGDKLALGTNLFSGKQTLIEQYGEEKVNNEFICYSEFYNKKLLNE